MSKCFRIICFNNHSIIFLISKIITTLDISPEVTAPTLSTVAVEGYWYRPLKLQSDSLLIIIYEIPYSLIAKPHLEIMMAVK